MAKYGEWNRKGATLSDVTARKEYGVSRDFIVKGIRAGKLEHREGAVWGNPYLRVLRSQLEQYIAEQLGTSQLESTKTQTALRKVKKEIAELKKKLTVLEVRKAEIERAAANSGPKSASPNSGPATRCVNSGVSEGPPSVS